MTSSFVVNFKGAAHTSAPTPLENTSPCFSLCGIDSVSTSSTSSRRAAEIRGTKSAAAKVGLPRAVSLCDIASCSVGQVRNTATLQGCPGTPSRINRVEPVRCSTWNRARRSTDSERRCFPATEREPVAEDESEAEVSGNEFGSSGLSKLSHFLRELARQDCWAGLLEPFQGAGNFSSGSFLHSDWNLRPQLSSSISRDTLPNMTTSEYDSQDSAAFRGPSSAAEQEQPTTRGSSAILAACMPDSDLGPATSTEYRSSQPIDDVGSPGAKSLTGLPRVNGSSLQFGVNGSSVRVHDKPHAELCHKSATCVTAEEIGSCENLARWLEERIGISALSQWGSAAATKRVANLWCELVEGEISLEDSRPPKRTAHVASVKIRNDRGHVLVEAYQQMADGRVRPRNRPLSEKMRPGEHVEEACLRGIFEELGCQMGARERVVMIPESYRREEEERESFSYPGLPTRYVIHTMVAHVEQLPSTEFSTEEDESSHGSSVSGASNDESVSRSTNAPVGVKRHFWKWVPENELAAVCRR